MTIAQDLDLSPLQERLRTRSASYPDVLFRVESRLRLPEGKTFEEVRAALLSVLTRHDVLRLSLPPAIEGSPSPKLLTPEDALRFSRHDREQVGESLERELRTLRAPLQGRGPILRALLLETPEGPNHLHWVLPATNGDATTLDCLATELLAELSDGPLERPDVIPHSALVGRLLDQSREPSASHILERWQAHLFAAPRALEFPFGPPIQATGRFDPLACTQPLARAVVERIHLSSPGQPEQLPDWILAAWRLLLWRTSGEADLVLGLHVPVRADAPNRSTPGPLDFEVPLHIAVSKQLTFRELVERTSASRKEVSDPSLFFSWDLPGARVGHDDAKDGFLYTFADRHRAPGDADVPCTSHRIEGVEPFDLSLVLEGEIEAPTIRLQYDGSRIANADAARMLERLETLLQSAAEDPDASVASLDILGAAEREQILRDGAGPPCPPPDQPTAQAQFEARARLTPEAPAIHFDEHTLSYGELNARANRLAHHLREWGVGPNVFVGVLFQPSFELMIALLGVLKAGGAYVPLDPEYPEERLRFLMEDAGVSILIRGKDMEGAAGVFASGTNAHVLELGPNGHGLPETSRSNPEPVNAPTDFVYMIYTSGSTGRPKGVLVNHRNLSLSTHARTLLYGDAPERFLLLSSFAFDSSVAGIFWTLTTGGALVLPRAGTQRDPVLVDQLIARWKVTHTLCLASHWAVLLSRAEPQAFSSIHTSVVSGEVFSTGLIESHDEVTSGARLFNEYGPTEDTVWSTVFDCHSPFAGNRVPIGRAIPGTRVYVLNDAMQLAPIGSPGELYLGGKGVAQGYHHRPERTATAFVPDPFRPGTGERLYRSGDRVRMLSDGNLEFLGRFDDQVKLRGYRIELGEIEAVLGQFDELRESAVLCRDATSGDKHLVAYYSCRPGQTTSARVLRERLGEKLPEYMIPSAFVELPELPRTTIGKLDVDALPAPTSGRDDLHESFVPPRNSVESVLASIWEDVLERDEVGVLDDFFDLGGHSILAGRIVYHVRERLDAELPLRSLFEEPTIAGLAAILRSDPAERARIDAAADIYVEVLADGVGS